MPKIDCPHCGRTLEYQSIKDHPHFPFCSERCRLVDLGMWFEAEHRITEDLFDRHAPKEADRKDKSKA